MTTTTENNSEDHLVIDCDSCCMQNTPVCADCVVTFLCDERSPGAVVIDLDEMRSLRMLNEAGLAPALRHRSTTG